MLAVVLVYLGLRAVTRIGVTRGAFAAFAIACLVELGQWLNLAARLGFRADSVAGTVLGASFDGGDILAYAVGLAGILLFERLRR